MRQHDLGRWQQASFTRRRLMALTSAAGLGAVLGGRSIALAQDKTKLVWSTWGSPEELTRYNEFDAKFVAAHPDLDLELIAVPSYEEYHPKMLTQLAAGSGPDALYIGDDNIGKFVVSGALLDLTEMLNGESSQSKPEDFFSGLWGAALTPEGRYFGVTNDCNPQVLWYNKTTLNDAGVTDDPASMQAAGKWTWEAFSGICAKLAAAGKHGAVLENWFADTYSLISSNGGAIYADGKYMATEDPKSVAALRLIYDNVAAKSFTASNFLPEGQGAGALFISGLAGFRSAGRWFLPTVKDALKPEEYDVVSWPTNTGNPIEPSGIATSFMGINAKSAHPEQAFTFLTNFVSKEGQIFRLQGGGNAVPSIKGADEVVSEDGIPANNAIFLQTRESGFVEPAEETRVAGLPQDILKGLEPLWLAQGDFDATVKALGEMVNAKLADAAS
ncbi:MAG: sugar ABC transporter substrate-binding protein [Thermomicrobiales bacterium]